ncbi:MAG: class I fructose-bisphosphate aldolase [bacterium]
MSELNEIAKKMVSAGKGILAADESSGSVEKKLASVGIESTKENRRAYREMLLGTEGIEKYISGVILFDETFRDEMSDGKKFLDLLKGKGILAGIKVDKGAKPLANFPGETITEGLDGLRERFEEYQKMGASFAKWRAVITIGDKIPSEFAIEANAEALARYAALAQEAGLVPIVEPEVLMEGVHTIERCEEVTGRTLDATFEQLRKHKVELSGVILKPNMVIAGMKNEKKAVVSEIAKRTIECFRKHIPTEIPGIVFLSGGQSGEEATINLNEINKIKGDSPWEISFSYGRALQDEALQLWRGKPENVAEARKLFLERARKVALARMGKYEA